MPTLAELRQFARYHLVRRVYDYPARETELGIVPLGYDADEFEAQVRAFGDRYDVTEAARVSYRGSARPVLRVATRGLDRARRRLLVLSGVHGNEHAGILCIPALLERFASRTHDVGLAVLTPVNPVGAAELSRFNAEGYDVNRDFVRFYTEEARAVRRELDAVAPHFVVSLHEGPHDATFMFANRHVTSDVAERCLAALRAGGTRLASVDYFGARLRTPGLSPSSRATRVLEALWAGALGMMATNAFAAGRGIPELTLESSWRSPDREARLRAHVDLCLAVGDELAAT